MKFAEELQAFQALHPFKTAEVEGCVFHYLLCGWEESQVTLVYFVGGTGNPLGWYRHVLAMEGKYRVLLLDYPMGVDEMMPMVKRIGSLIEKLGIQKAVWIGASFGGYIAQLMGREYPEKTRAMALYATTALTEEGIADLKKQYRYVGKLLWLMEHIPYGLLKGLVMKPSMKRLIPSDPSVDREYISGFISWIYDDYTREKDLHMTRLMADIVNLNPVRSEDYEYLNGRILLILPEKDQAFTEKMQQDLVNLLQNPKTEFMPGGHLATLLSAEEFAERTDDFLKEIKL